MTEQKHFSTFLLRLFRSGKDRLDALSVLNVLLLFGLLVFAVVDSVGNTVVFLFYLLVTTISQFFFGTQAYPTVDTTPFFAYGGVLLLGVVLCMIIVKRNVRNVLW